MGTIVVGIDGSPASDRALRWACDEARHHGDRVVALHVWVYPYVGPRAALHDPYDELRRAAAETLDAAVERVLATLPYPIEVERVLAEGSPSSELLHASRDARLLVLGSRGRGGLASLLLGSVSHQVAHHAKVPVVIVR